MSINYVSNSCPIVSNCSQLIFHRYEFLFHRRSFKFVSFLFRCLKMIDNYFFSYVPQQTNRYLNITLTVLDHGNVREHQTILVEEYFPDYRSHRNIQYNLVSSSAFIQTNAILFGILFILIELKRHKIG